MPDSQFISETEWRSWLPVAKAIEMLDPYIGGAAAITEVYERLQTDHLKAAAQSSVWYQGRKEDRRQYERIFPLMWQTTGCPPIYDRLWTIGTRTFTMRDDSSYRDEDTAMYGIRFEPVGIDAILAECGGFTANESLVANTPSQSAPPVNKRKPLPEAEVRKFCRAIVAGWPDANQDWAHEKARIFYPENDVPRDWFRRILRSIRPEKKPGRTPKIRD